MNLKLIALDIDGTLTNDNKEVTPKTLSTLLDAQKEGVRLVLASARPSPGLFRMRDLLRMRENRGILMSYNGGRIVDARTEKTLSEICIDREVVRNLLRFLETLPVTVILDDGKQFYVTDRNGYKVQYECWNNDMTCTEVDNLADFLTFSPIKLLLSVEPERILEIQKIIADHLTEDLSVVRTAAFYLEIIPRSINKGQGLRDICQVLGIDIRDTVAFGDAENDLPMLKAAGIGFAMGNAEEAVRMAVDRVTLNNNEDGIAIALEELKTEKFQ